jgi:hypothetical protein
VSKPAAFGEVVFLEADTRPQGHLDIFAGDEPLLPGSGPDGRGQALAGTEDDADIDDERHLTIIPSVRTATLLVERAKVTCAVAAMKVRR